METMKLVLDAINSIGFPIVISLLAAWYIKYTGDVYREQIDKISARQDEQLDKLTEAVSALTDEIRRRDGGLK